MYVLSWILPSGMAVAQPGLWNGRLGFHDHDEVFQRELPGCVGIPPGERESGGPFSENFLNLEAINGEFEVFRGTFLS